MRGFPYVVTLEKFEINFPEVCSCCGKVANGKIWIKTPRRGGLENPKVGLYIIAEAARNIKVIKTMPLRPIT